MKQRQSPKCRCQEGDPSSRLGYTGRSRTRERLGRWAGRSFQSLTASATPAAIGARDGAVGHAATVWLHALLRHEGHVAFGTITGAILDDLGMVCAGVLFAGGRRDCGRRLRCRRGHGCWRSHRRWGSDGRWRARGRCFGWFGFVCPLTSGKGDCGRKAQGDCCDLCGSECSHMAPFPLGETSVRIHEMQPPRHLPCGVTLRMARSPNTG